MADFSLLEKTGVDLAPLVESLKALSSENRLELLALLRNPRTIDEIVLTPGPTRAGSRPERPLARQTVREHLEQLVATGIVRVRLTDRHGKRGQQEFVLDRARLFAALEDIRKLGSLTAFVPLDPGDTRVAGREPEPAWDEGPKLVLVHGVKEGTAFPLRSELLKEGRGWVIGRREGVAVNLSYDPFVSHHHAEILRDGERFRLMDLRTARNGTLVNWHRLPVGGEARLEPGDVIGVGRSLLVFRQT